MSMSEPLSPPSGPEIPPPQDPNVPPPPGPDILPGREPEIAPRPEEPDIIQPAPEIPPPLPPGLNRTQGTQLDIVGPRVWNRNAIILRALGRPAAHPIIPFYRP